MNFAKFDENIYIIRLVKGEEIITAITSFCNEHNIKNAVVSAIGSVEGPTLAHFRVDSKKYSEKKLTGIFELTNLSGNISLFANAPLPHIHISLANDQMQAFGGHLVNALVSATVEMTMTVYPTAYEKKVDEEIGLKLWELEKES